MKRFHYCLSHKADEAYMAKLCHEGWAATRPAEGTPMSLFSGSPFI